MYAQVCPRDTAALHALAYDCNSCWHMIVIRRGMFGFKECTKQNNDGGGCGEQLSEIKEMTARERLRERKIQELKRRGRPVNEATLAAVEAELRLLFNSPRTLKGATGATGAKPEEHMEEQQEEEEAQEEEPVQELKPAAE